MNITTGTLVQFKGTFNSFNQLEEETILRHDPTDEEDGSPDECDVCGWRGHLDDPAEVVEGGVAQVGPHQVPHRVPGLLAHLKQQNKASHFGTTHCGKKRSFF